MRQLKISPQITIRDSEALERYLAEIAKEELLKPEEEVALTQRIRQGDDEALEKLVKANLRFVVSVAKQYQNQGLSLSDLINEGNIGLIKAAKRFDETKGFKFISYAVWWIRQTILQALAEHARMVRLPVNKVGMVSKINQVFSELSQKFEREPTAEEIARELNLTEKEIKELMLSDSVESLDAPISPDDKDYKLIDKVSGFNPEKNSAEEKSHINEIISRMLHKLNKRDAEILKMYYGIGYDREYTLEEIGEHFQLTRERVRQLKDKALNLLKKYSNELLKD